jgi:O-antigen/teichoic acid export membrane protein
VSLASGWAVRTKSFGTLAKTAVSSSLVGNSFKIGAGVIGHGGGALIVATVLQQWFHLAVLTTRLRQTIPSELTPKNEGWQQAKIYSEFPKYRMLQDTLSVFANQLPNVLLALYFSPAIVGFYLLTVRVIQAPSNIIRESIRKVFYQKAAEIKNKGGDLVQIFDRMTLIMVSLTLPPILMFVAFGPQLFNFVFGDEWIEAGRYSRYIILMIALSFANVPGVSAVTAIGKNKQLLGFGIISMIARTLAIVISGLYFSAEVAIAVYALTCATKDIVLIVWCRIALVKFQINA